jgi:hypothetical protein
MNFKATIEFLYRELLARAPDPDGLLSGEERLQQGAIGPQLAAEIMASPEFERRVQVGKLPRVPALATQASEALVGVRSEQELFSHYDERFLRHAYHAILRRAVDDSGLATYRAALRAGDSRDAVLHTLVCSNEAKAAEKLVNELAQSSLRVEHPVNERATLSFASLPTTADLCKLPRWQFFVATAYMLTGRPPLGDLLRAGLDAIKSDMSVEALRQIVLNSSECAERAQFIAALKTRSARIHGQHDGFTGRLRAFISAVMGSEERDRVLHRIENALLREQTCFDREEVSSAVSLSSRDPMVIDPIVLHELHAASNDANMVQSAVVSSISKRR